VKAEEIAAIAAAISAVAALVSLLVAAYFGWTQAHAAEPKVLVTGGTAFSVQGPTLGPPYYLVTVANRGIVPVTVTSVGFELKGKKTMPSMTPRDPRGVLSVPKRLDPGESTEVVFDHAELGQVQRDVGIIRAFALTATGDRYHGRRVDGRALAGWK
jgi:hypothetical protein